LPKDVIADPHEWHIRGVSLTRWLAVSSIVMVLTIGFNDRPVALQRSLPAGASSVAARRLRVVVVSTGERMWKCGSRVVCEIFKAVWTAMPSRRDNS
jgi:hypothetical protein